MAASRANRPASSCPPSHVEAEVHHVAVAHHVVLALDGQLARLARSRLAAELHVVLPPDDLGLDEALLEVRMDDARGAGGLAPATDGPGAHLGLAGGEGPDAAEQLEARADDGVQTGLGETGAGEKLRAVGGV